MSDAKEAMILSIRAEKPIICDNSLQVLDEIDKWRKKYGFSDRVLFMIFPSKSELYFEGKSRPFGTVLPILP